jgi:predicted acetyltransferase
VADDLEIRHVDIAEIEAFNRSMVTTFLEDVSTIERGLPWRRRLWETDRTWGAYDRGRVVGTLRTLDRQFTVPGPSGAPCADLQVDALTAVTVSATHRRRGILRRMLGDSLAAAHDRGDPLSILVAAEWMIYGRFGYSPAAYWSDPVIDRRRSGAELRVPATGVVYQVDVEELRQLAPAIYAGQRTTRAGQINRVDALWDGILLSEYRAPGDREPTCIVHEGDDGVDGYLSWHATQDFGWVKGGTIAVDEVVATNQAAYTALWAYLFGLDVVEHMKLERRPVDEPLPHLLVNGRAVQPSYVGDAVWVRLLDVPAALAGRGYAGAGEICFEISDDDVGGYGAGRFLLEAAPEGATCRPAPERTPDLRLSQRALAAVYLGQPAFRHQHSAGLVDEETPGAIARADALFNTALLPWVSTGF